MKYYIFCLVGIVFAISLACCSEDIPEENTTESTIVEDDYDAGIEDDIITHELEKISIKETEMANPKEYLVLNAEGKKNLLGVWNVKGSIKNTATKATYKKLVLNVTYYNKEDEVLAKSMQTMESSIAPNSTMEIKLKLGNSPKGANRVEVALRF